jgi:hypothetical protein
MRVAGVEDDLEGVDRAGPDVSENHAKGTNHQPESYDIAADRIVAP